MKSNNPRRSASWYIINIVARHQQNPLHYIKALKTVSICDPMCHIRGSRYASLGSLNESEMKDNDIPTWMELKLWSYDILDKDKFFSKVQKEKVVMDIPSDVVANQAEETITFIPSRHKALLKCSGSISLNAVLKFLTYALNEVEPNEFEVTTVKDREVLNVIYKSYSIVKFEAELFYSNDGHFDDFTQSFDGQIKKSGAKKFKMSLEGSDEEPLSTEEGSIVRTATTLSEQDGFVVAKLKRTEHSKYETINTEDHPVRISITADRSQPSQDIYNAIRAKYE